MADKLDNLMYLACMFDPDIFVMQIHDATLFDYSHVKDLRAQHPKSIFVNWNGDYHPEELFAQRYILLARAFDYTGLVTTEIADIYNRAGVKWFYWQIGYEAEHNPGRYAMPKYDVLFMGNAYSNERKALGIMLRDLKGLNVGVYGSWPKSFKPNGITLYDFDAGYALYRNCKIAIGDSQWPHSTGFVSNRLFQAMAAGAFLLHQTFDGMTELLGLKDGEHLVVWNNFDDLQEKIRYYLDHPIERMVIANTGQDYVLAHHSFDARVNELFERVYG